MSELIHSFIASQAQLRPAAPALYFKKDQFTYGELEQSLVAVSAGLRDLGLTRGERVAIYLPKVPECVFSIFGVSDAGGVFVPVNPLLKPAQVAYILKDCNVRILVTSNQRLAQLADVLTELEDLHSVVVTDEEAADIGSKGKRVTAWPDFVSRRAESTAALASSRVDSDIAAILYTSGSTGNPKGVVLSHRNMVAGAHSVASYLKNTERDCLLAVLPFSFDYGLSQLTTAFSRGASVVLMDYLLPRDVIKAAARHGVTGLAAVPPLWNQLADLDWPPEVVKSLRYITNSGGAMPLPTTERLRRALPDTEVFLMYGLTEAFRSTFLPPAEVERRPDSIGKAIPNAEILVVRPDGTECAADEPGELVHRGPLVALGYWNDPAKTAERFKPAPGRPAELPLPEIAVWSGDEVKKDKDGYLYFVSRKDEMIKTSGYRVSPTEVEDVVYTSEMVREVAALGLPHKDLGQAILLLVVAGKDLDETELLRFCQRELPNFMIPQAVLPLDELPRNQNGKIDRKALSLHYQDYFSS